MNALVLLVTISVPGADPLPPLQPQAASYTVERPGLLARLRGERPGLINRLRGRFGRAPSSAQYPWASAPAASPASPGGVAMHGNSNEPPLAAPVVSNSSPYRPSPSVAYHP